VGVEIIIRLKKYDTIKLLRETSKKQGNFGLWRCTEFDKKQEIFKK